MATVPKDPSLTARLKRLATGGSSTCSSSGVSGSSGSEEDTVSAQLQHTGGSTGKLACIIDKENIPNDSTKKTSAKKRPKRLGGLLSSGPARRVLADANGPRVVSETNAAQQEDTHHSLDLSNSEEDTRTLDGSHMGRHKIVHKSGKPHVQCNTEIRAGMADTGTGIHAGGADEQGSMVTGKNCASINEDPGFRSLHQKLVHTRLPPVSEDKREVDLAELDSCRRTLAQTSQAHDHAREGEGISMGKSDHGQVDTDLGMGAFDVASRDGKRKAEVLESTIQASHLTTQVTGDETDTLQGILSATKETPTSSVQARQLQDSKKEEIAPGLFQYDSKVLDSNRRPSQRMPDLIEAAKGGVSVDPSKSRQSFQSLYANGTPSLHSNSAGRLKELQNHGDGHSSQERRGLLSANKMCFIETPGSAGRPPLAQHYLTPIADIQRLTDTTHPARRRSVDVAECVCATPEMPGVAERSQTGASRAVNTPRSNALEATPMQQHPAVSQGQADSHSRAGFRDPASTADSRPAVEASRAADAAVFKANAAPLPPTASSRVTDGYTPSTPVPYTSAHPMSQPAPASTPVPPAPPTAEPPVAPSGAGSTPAGTRLHQHTTTQPRDGRPSQVATGASHVGNRIRREDEHTIRVRDTLYQKLQLVGKGGSSKVYKVIAPNRQIFALKRIRLSGRDPESARGFVEEITLLKRLRGKRNIIQLIDAEVVAPEGLIYVVLEYGEIDLANLLVKMQWPNGSKLSGPPSGPPSSPAGCRIDENFLRLYWQNMLEAVHTIHEERIVHSDLKPANFLLVQGQLKLIDFGIARALQNDTTNIVRDTQVGTLNYMSPEAIVGNERLPGDDGLGSGGIKVSRGSDIWSLGCILYQMVYGQTPFSHLPVIPKLQAITNPNHHISFPQLSNPWLLETIKRCLDRSPITRITIPQLLEHPFLRPDLAPIPSLPKEPESKPAGGAALNEQQLQKILEQLAKISAQAPGSFDIGKATQEIFSQLAAKGSVDMEEVFKKAGFTPKEGGAAVPPAPRPAPPPPPPPGKGPPKLGPPKAPRAGPTGQKGTKPAPSGPSMPSDLAAAVAAAARRRAESGRVVEVGNGSKPGQSGLSMPSDLAAAVAASARRRAESGRNAGLAGGSREGKGKDDDKGVFQVPTLRKTGSANGGGPGGFRSAEDLEAAIKARQAALRPVRRGEEKKPGEGAEREKDKGGSAAPWEGILRKGIERFRTAQDNKDDETTMDW